MDRFLRFQFPAVAWVGVIFASSAMPTEFFGRFGVEQSWAPKVVHVLFFFLLCFFLSRALRHQQVSPFVARWSLVLSVLLCLTFGIVDEVHQIFVSGRHPRITDVFLDLSGATLMAITLWLREWVQSLRRERVPS